MKRDPGMDEIVKRLYWRYKCKKYPSIRWDRLIQDINMYPEIYKTVKGKQVILRMLELRAASITSMTAYHPSRKVRESCHREAAKFRRAMKAWDFRKAYEINAGIIERIKYRMRWQ